MPFHKIRRHVTREGRRLGCARDSPASHDDHLMVMLFDLLLSDDIVCLDESQDRRRRRLWATVQCIPGQVEISERCKLDFRMESAPGRLAEQMAHAIAHGWEGLVLKDCQAPYIVHVFPKVVSRMPKHLLALGLILRQEPNLVGYARS
jgi:DNA ligase 4